MILDQLIQEFNMNPTYAQNVVNLIDEGNTIPFIARYRKELTGHCDDQVLRAFSDRLEYLRNLEKRKEEVRKSITEQDKMTDELNQKIEMAVTLTEVEDLYRPFKQKRSTRAGKALEAGLKPLADIIMLQDDTDVFEVAKEYINPEKKINTVQDAINGAKDIIAETVSDDADVRKKLRNMVEKSGEVSTKLVEDAENSVTYEMYKDYAENVSQMKSHRVLAVNRGEKEGCLKVKVSFPEEIGKRVSGVRYIKKDPFGLVKESVDDSYDRLIYPSIEREIRTLLTDRASEQAIKAFETNLKPLLMQSPMKGKVTMGLDPAYRTGCKIAVVDATGKVLDKTVVYPTPPQNKVEEAKAKLKQLIDKYNVDVISIGNGTASKESEIFVCDLIKELDREVSYVVVSEAGASVYSASPLGAEEFPDYDVSERSAVSIARRLQDPLAELIKIDPKSIGVGQYQHDMDQKRLDSVLAGVLEDCVNSVGVNLNTASVSLLKFVSGLNASIAKNIVTYREENGKFKNRTQLKKVPKLGEKTFVQCAGFLRIDDGDNILDNTSVHPESYEVANKLLEIFGYDKEDVKANKVTDIMQKVKDNGIEKVCAVVGSDKSTVMDIVTELMKPGRDIRDGMAAVSLRKDLMDISDVKVGMVIDGVVRNVTDFGAFVDIGVHQDGLVHISQISDKFVKSASDVVKVGQKVRVRVIEVDVKKKRIGLSMKSEKNS